MSIPFLTFLQYRLARSLIVNYCNSASYDPWADIPSSFGGEETPHFPGSSMVGCLDSRHVGNCAIKGLMRYWISKKTNGYCGLLFGKSAVSGPGVGGCDRSGGYRADRGDRTSDGRRWGGLSGSPDTRSRDRRRCQRSPRSRAHRMARGIPAVSGTCGS